MKKVQVAMDFIMLYKNHKRGAFYYPNAKKEDGPLKEKEKGKGKERERNGLKKL
jgi:hypothetical protein